MTLRPTGPWVGVTRAREPLSAVDQATLDYLEAYVSLLRCRTEYLDVVLVRAEASMVAEAVKRIREGSL